MVEKESPRAGITLGPKFHWTDLVICSHSRDGLTPFYSQINLLNYKRSSTAHSLSLSTSHRPDMTETLSKRR